MLIVSRMCTRPALALAGALGCSPGLSFRDTPPVSTRLKLGCCVSPEVWRSWQAPFLFKAL